MCLLFYVHVNKAEFFCYFFQNGLVLENAINNFNVLINYNQTINMYFWEQIFSMLLRIIISFPILQERTYKNGILSLYKTGLSSIK